jgi:hypothetical protein
MIQNIGAPGELVVDMGTQLLIVHLCSFCGSLREVRHGRKFRSLVSKEVLIIKPKGKVRGASGMPAIYLCASFCCVQDRIRVPLPGSGTATVNQDVDAMMYI